MNMISAVPAGAQGILFVVSTSHMDWNWIATFEQYYNTGKTYPSDSGPDNSVRYILDQALFNLQDSISPGYQYNLAEMAWLKRYLQDNPTLPPMLAGLQGSLFFLGGGITSPDNLVCNGEAFIRNYLLGRTYAKSIGLGNLLTDVC